MLDKKNTHAPRRGKRSSRASPLKELHAHFHSAIERGTPWADALAAYELAQLGVAALAGNRESIDEVRRLDAARRKASGDNSQALGMLEIRRLVSVAVHFRSQRKDASYASVGASAAGDLRACLVKRFGKTVPTVDDLEDWIDRHSKTKARDKLTTAGIVGRIVYRGRLLGVMGMKVTEEGTVNRAAKVFARHSQP